MREHQANQEVDPLLLPFLETADEVEARLLLDGLIELAANTIKRISGWSRDPEDAFQKAAQQLIEQLWELRSDPCGRAIGNYIRYAKVVASRAAKAQLRDAHPQRRSLVDALRHTLKSNINFASWQDEPHDRLWGLTAWGNCWRRFGRSPRLNQLLDNPRLLDDAVVFRRDVHSLDHAELLTGIFTWVGHPIRFDELVKIVCEFKRLDASPVV